MSHDDETGEGPARIVRPWSAADPIRFAWERVKADPFVIVGGVVLAIVLSGAIGAILGGLARSDVGALGWFASTVGSLGNWLVSAFMAGGLTRFCLKICRGERYGFDDLWSGGRTVGPILLAEILTAIAVGVGLVFLIVPGIVLALGLSLAVPLIVDRSFDPLAALKESWRLTRGYKTRLFAYALLLVGLAMLGLMACGVGLLLVAALACIGNTYVYLRLTGQATAPPRVEA